MLFKRIAPAKELNNIIECYWIAENNNSEPVEEKIIPDGFTEMIFHYGDPYLIRFKNTWEQQAKTLLAGQISRYFFLQNTGLSGVLGIKFKPTALTHLYSISMAGLTDKVIDLSELNLLDAHLIDKINYNTDHQTMFSLLNQHFKPLVERYQPGLADKAIEMIFATKGMLSIGDLKSALFTTEKQLERVFKHFIGLSPKLYCRIVRFNYLFECKQNGNKNWADVFHTAGFYDQSHFIRNFKGFTGDEPSSYLYEKNNLGNFFLKKHKS
jgi:AraC-like DNA-binding protein